MKAFDFFLIVIGFVFLAIISCYAIDEASDAYSQKNFPCAEDEVLGYAPQFGPDRVGCIHIDTLKG
ncbi:hypothetical protein SEA_ORANGE_89 [Mycobacterium phage Orange]|nr:hypothetical protein SEA_EBONY_88 [Mycobacterium phage Ebony]AXC33545.1 hypothetical protein SEA_JOSELITO_87 [Mycobacterium phage Joselito]AXH50768.1 hypothetical protein SEA_SNAPE_89 [Mycobacterium phage Snape]QBI97914.1 hypothetical protein SEA_ORANGE_89 [Mycobacterium phage Orange]QBI98251.1 hypothetical protein SEA_BOWTIE_85 [Mycobacterium phage Bowtie]QBI98457.1 hypothetical protein SEA_MUNCH_88 [Mycobacterium phage Munch]QBI98542.1 hypothetical protein SEA_BUD_82 [Mycobacterium phage